MSGAFITSPNSTVAKLPAGSVKANSKYPLLLSLPIEIL